MSSHTAEQTLLRQVRLPEQDLSDLSFCDGSKPAKVRQWVESLPATRVSYTSVQLYKALPELARLRTEPAIRLEMLESVRPYVQQCIQGLSKDFLNQPLILPEAALKTATVAQALQKHMTNAYVVATRDLSAKLSGARIKGFSKLHEQLMKATHRAITGLSLQLLRSYQLYIPVPKQLWTELHELYRLAEHFNILDRVIADPLLQHTQGCSIKHAYLRVLLLACSRPNQLSQSEVSATYSGLEQWTGKVTLSATEEQNLDNLFLVNLSSDLPPMYKWHFRGNAGDDVRELDTRQLINAIKKQKDSKVDKNAILAIPREVTPLLLDHLASAWAESHQRSFDRRPAQGSLEVSVGLSNIHFHLSGGTPFQRFIHRNSSDPFSSPALQFQAQPLSSEKDPWSEAFDVGGNIIPGTHLINDNISDKDSDKNQHPIFSVRMIDASPGGYCLDWRNEIPPHVRAGEPLCLRENGRQKWSLGVIRWIRQARGATMLGIQVLAPQAFPYGAAMLQKTGDSSQYMRVLMLPEIKAINQPASLITTVVPFQEYAKVKLNKQGEESLVQLTRRLFSTGSISQFSFRELEAAKPEASDAGNKSFESVWDDI